eukprot:6200795-Pleurochrysis_carterae.AAC.1
METKRVAMSEKESGWYKCADAWSCQLKNKPHRIAHGRSSLYAKKSYREVVTGPCEGKVPSSG